MRLVLRRAQILEIILLENPDRFLVPTEYEVRLYVGSYLSNATKNGHTASTRQQRTVNPLVVPEECKN